MKGRGGGEAQGIADPPPKKTYIVCILVTFYQCFLAGQVFSVILVNCFNATCKIDKSRFTNI
jgi:hypothetical protein